MKYENPEIKSYRDIVAWQKAYAIGLSIYSMTKTFPDSERFALTSQLRRSGVSVASNIAEGYGRGGQGDYVRFLKVARGSLYELQTQVSFACDLGYVDRSISEPILTQIEECSRILGGLIRANETDY